MKRKFHPMISLLTLLSLASVNAFADNEKGNGGGLVQRNGEYLSFTAAGVNAKVTVVELEPEQLPELNSLAKNLENTLLLPEYADRIRQTLRPTRQRRYFKTSLDQLSPIVHRQILAKYRSLMGTRPGDSITLAAITRGYETYLFEPFFALKSPVSREAILLHEAIWTANGESEYANVIAIETAYEKCFTRTNPAASKVVCGGLSRALIQNMGGTDLSMERLQYAAMEDQALNHLPGILNEAGDMKIEDLLGNRFLELNVLDPIEPAISAHLEAMHARYPKSALFYELRKSATTLGFLGASYIGPEKFRTATYGFLAGTQLRVTDLQHQKTRVLSTNDFTDLMDHETEFLARGPLRVWESQHRGWCLDFGVVKTRNPQSYTPDASVGICLLER